MLLRMHRTATRPSDVKQHAASIISSPLLNNVAESMVIFLPMPRRMFERRSNGDAGKFSFAWCERSADAVSQSCGRNWTACHQTLKIAECSLATAARGNAVLARLAITNSPPSQESLDAMAMSLPRTNRGKCGLQSRRADDGNETMSAARQPWRV